MKIENGLKLAYLGFVGISATYFAFYALDEKAHDLVKDKGIMNAILIGAGQMGASVAVGMATMGLVGIGIAVNK